METKRTNWTMALLVFVLMARPVWADAPNSLNDEGEAQAAQSSASSALTLPFDPNNYNFLIYDCGGDSGQNQIQAAMQKLGLEYTLCNAANPVTANHLQTHDILIVGWAITGDKSGLSSSIIDAGITGRVILSGHDSDYHTVNIEPGDVATIFFIL